MDDLSASTVDITSRIYPGCHPAIAEAIESFYACWKSYSVSSRKYPLYRLFSEKISPAWQVFIKSLPANSVNRKYLRDLDFEAPLRDRGFEDLKQQLWNISLSTQPVIFYPSIRLTELRPLRQTAIQSSKQKSGATDTRGITPTIDSLISLVESCGKKPRRVSSAKEKNINELRATSMHCKFCKNETELRSYLNASIHARNNNWTHDKDGTPTLNFSSKYCSAHRPKNHDASWNSEYKRATRISERLDTEIQRLTRQTRSVITPLARSGSVAVDLFYRRIVNSRPIPSNEIEKAAVIKRIAEDLIRYRINDTKKFIVAMSSAGFSQKEIGICLGKTPNSAQQAISRVLSSVPTLFRFDLQAGPDDVHHQLKARLKNDSVPSDTESQLRRPAK